MALTRIEVKASPPAENCKTSLKIQGHRHMEECIIASLSSNIDHSGKKKVPVKELKVRRTAVEKSEETVIKPEDEVSKRSSMAEKRESTKKNFTYRVL